MSIPQIRWVEASTAYSKLMPDKDQIGIYFSQKEEAGMIDHEIGRKGLQPFWMVLFKDRMNSEA